MSLEKEVSECQLVTDLNADLPDILHQIRAGWRLSCFDKFLQGKRHEVESVKHTSSAQLLQVDWDAPTGLADNSPAIRAVITGATVSYAWLGEPCPWCQGQGDWIHMAWHCPASTLITVRPRCPDSGWSHQFSGRVLRSGSAQNLTRMRPPLCS